MSTGGAYVTTIEVTDHQKVDEMEEETNVDTEAGELPSKPYPPTAVEYGSPTPGQMDFDDDADIDHSDGKVLFAKDENKQRGNWSNVCDFMLAIVGMNVGLGNIWRFPYLVYSNGGAPFLIPYVVMMLFVGIPLTMLELGLGQFASRGPPNVWKCVPVFKGIGFAALIGMSFLMIYYNMVLGWGFFYLAHSFSKQLPWSSCSSTYNSPSCTNASASGEFFNYMLTGGDKGSYDIGNLGTPWWPLICCLVASWFVVYLSLVKGVKSSGKVVYFTALWPYVVLIILLIMALLRPGYYEGIKYYIIVADWSKLGEAKIWKDAASQIFFSLSLGGGPVVTLASYNRFHTNVIRDTMIASVGNCLTSFFAGFVVFAFMGNLAYETGLPVQDVTDSGPGLMFVVYPQAFSYLPIPHFWNIIFFIMVVTLGFDSVFGVVEGIATAVMDEFPKLHRHRPYVYLIVCIVLCACGISLTTPGGINVLSLLDHYATPYTLLVGGLFEAVAIGWFYGARRFAMDIQVMVGYQYGKWLLCACLYIITPLLILFAFIYEAIDRQAYIPGFPLWSAGLGYAVAMISIIFIPIVGVYQCCCMTRPSRNRGKNCCLAAISPAEDWGPALRRHRQEVADAGYAHDFVVTPGQQRGEDNVAYYT